MTSKTARCLFIAASVAAAAAAAQNSTVATAGAAAASGNAPYKVVDGFYVDDLTLQGFHTWRAAACDRCHGANQQGLVGPSLIESLKTLTKADFVKTVTEGRLEKGMPSWSASPNVMQNIDALYAYLKGRSDGAITQAHVQPMAQAPSASGTRQQ
jgi:mono/diheme cytochrome c family protein